MNELVCTGLEITVRSIKLWYRETKFNHSNIYLFYKANSFFSIHLMKWNGSVDTAQYLCFNNIPQFYGHHWIKITSKWKKKIRYSKNVLKDCRLISEYKELPFFGIRNISKTRLSNNFQIPSWFKSIISSTHCWGVTFSILFQSVTFYRTSFGTQCWPVIDSPTVPALCRKFWF